MAQQNATLKDKSDFCIIGRKQQPETKEVNKEAKTNS